VESEKEAENMKVLAPTKRVREEQKEKQQKSRQTNKQPETSYD